MIGFLAAGSSNAGREKSKPWSSSSFERFDSRGESLLLELKPASTEVSSGSMLLFPLELTDANSSLCSGMVRSGVI